MLKKAAIFKGANKPFEIKEFDVVPPAAGQAGLNLVSSGICGTDVHIHDGFLGMPDMPLIIGHEFIGKIDALGEGVAKDANGVPLAVGDTAIASVAIPCGKCFNCRRGETASCLAFGVTYEKNAEEAPHFHGGFSEYLYSPFENLVKLPENVNPFAAAAFPCGGPTIIRSCAYGGGLEKDEIVVIQGNGSLGLFALAYAKSFGCKVIMIGSASNPERLALTEKLAPDMFLDFRKTSDEDAVKAVKEFASKENRGDGADVVIETSGSIKAFPLGLQLLRTRGRYFVPGQYSVRGPVQFDPCVITFKALNIVGSGQYTMADVKAYIEFLSANEALQDTFAQLVKKYPVSEANKAMADAKAGLAVKTVFA